MGVKAFLNKLHSYSCLMRFNKPIGIFLLLWPTLWALWLAAKGVPSLKILTIFILGVICMRSAGCVINDYADRGWDGKVVRTADRPLVTGKIHTAEALLLFSGLCLIALILVLMLNKLTILIAIAAVFFVVLYPFTKRITQWPQFFLGIAFASAVPMAFAAITGAVPLGSWLIFCACVLWTISYDTQYAVVDRADDLQVGIKSTAILFGKNVYLAILLLQISMLGLLLIVGKIMELHSWFYLGLLGATGFLSYQHYLMYKEAYFEAFLNNRWVGLSIFLGIFLNYC